VALRRTARVTGLLLVGLVLAFTFGYGDLPNVFTQPARRPATPGVIG
jgi:hypothetical protein